VRTVADGAGDQRFDVFPFLLAHLRSAVGVLAHRIADPQFLRFPDEARNEFVVRQGSPNDVIFATHP
jgi:hypothetical protein